MTILVVQDKETSNGKPVFGLGTRKAKAKSPVLRLLHSTMIACLDALLAHIQRLAFQSSAMALNGF